LQALSFFIDGELYAADVVYVQKFVRNIPITPVMATPDPVVGIANMKGRVITVLSLAVLISPDIGQAEAMIPGGGANAIVFKSYSDGDQIALRIDKPGGLLAIDDSDIHPLPVTAGTAEQLYVSGIAQLDDKLYRIINAKTIINQENTMGTIKQGGQINETGA